MWICNFLPFLCDVILFARYKSYSSDIAVNHHKAIYIREDLFCQEVRPEENQSNRNRTVTVFIRYLETNKKTRQKIKIDGKTTFKWHTSIKVLFRGLFSQRMLFSWHECYWWIEINKSLSKQHRTNNNSALIIKPISMNNIFQSQFMSVPTHKSHGTTRESNKFHKFIN